MTRKKVLTEVHPGVGVHQAQTSSNVPEPSTAVLMGVGALGWLSLLRRIGRRQIRRDVTLSKASLSSLQ